MSDIPLRQNMPEDKTSTARPKPTVLVKKKDGSDERVAIDQFERSHMLGGGRPEKIPQDKSVKMQGDPKTKKPINQKLTVAKQGALTTASPVTKIFVDEAVAKEQKIEGLVKKPPADRAQVAAFRERLRSSAPPLDTAAAGYPVRRHAMHDVEQVRSNDKTTVGPAEEMLSFTLTDFRRLAPRAKEASAKVAGKFDGWREESFFLYMQALDAWRKSPLYRAYQKVLIDSLRAGKSVSDVLEEDAENGMRADEFTGLIAINARLNS